MGKNFSNLLFTMDEDSLSELFDSDLMFDSLDQDEQEIILGFFQSTKSYKLIDVIALFLSDSNQLKALDALINVVSKLKGSNHLSTPVYACSLFDCTEFIELFVDLIINENMSACIESEGVIQEMKGPISNDTYDRIEHKIKDAIKYPKDQERIYFLEAAMTKAFELKE